VRLCLQRSIDFCPVTKGMDLTCPMQLSAAMGMGSDRPLGFAIISLDSLTIPIFPNCRRWFLSCRMSRVVEVDCHIVNIGNFCVLQIISDRDDGLLKNGKLVHTCGHLLEVGTCRGIR
jgi:hypothetical protein